MPIISPLTRPDRQLVRLALLGLDATEAQLVYNLAGEIEESLVSKVVPGQITLYPNFRDTQQADLEALLDGLFEDHVQGLMPRCITWDLHTDWITFDIRMGPE